MPQITKSFVLAGEAIFTVEIPADWQVKLDAPGHYTYKVEHVPARDGWSESWFVKLLAGPDNMSDYAYMGKLETFTGQLLLTRKSTQAADSNPVRILNRILARVWTDDHAAYEQFGFQLHHEGKCCRCGRRLTTPASVEAGIGPECAKIAAGEAA